MKRKIKRIDVFSTAKVLGAIYGILGLLLGLVFLILELVSPEGTGSIELIAVMFLLPVIYGAIGGICGGLGALMYNLVSKYFGGIKIELE